MKIGKEHITVFFFGSPGEGFTSYPSNYSSLVNGLDQSTSKYKLECKYIVHANKTKIQFAEYGLTGIGQHGKSRGGRNFGVWVEIKDCKINDLGQKKILKYISEFIKNGIIENVEIFREDNSKAKHYLVYSFNDIGSELDKLIEVFKDHFISDFNDYFQPILESDSYIIDLNPIKVVNKTPKPSITFSEKEIYSEIDIEEKSESGSKKKTINLDYHKLITLILTLVSLFLIISHLIHNSKSNDFKEDIEKRLQSIENSKPVVPITRRNSNVSSEVETDTKGTAQEKEFITLSNSLIKINPSMFYLNSNKNKLMFKVKYFKEKVTNDYSFSNSEKVIETIEKFLWTDSKLNTTFSITSRIEIKNNIKNNNKNYFKEIEAEINTKNSSSYPKIKSVFKKDFIILIDR